MEDHVLSEVVKVEKEVQQMLEIEKKTSQEWLENVKKNAEKKVLEEEANIKEAFNIILEKTKLNTDKKAITILRDANVKAERLEGLGDEILKKIILRHITKILPGA